MLVTTVAAIAFPASVKAQKTDTLILNNGDRIVGEIKGVYRGKLDYSTNDAGRLSIEWIKVFRLTSPRYYEIHDRWGTKHFGPLVRAAENGTIAIDGVHPDTLRIVDVVEIVELGAHFSQRVNGMFDLGYTHTKANNANTFSTRAEIEYRGPKIGSDVALDGYYQKQDNAEQISRQSASLNGSYFLPNRYSADGVFTAERNDELDLDLRVIGGGGVGRTLVESNRNSVEAAAGLVLTREQFSVDSADVVNNNNLEATFGIKAETFRFDQPKLRVVSSLVLFPSLTTPGRVRGGFSFEFSRESTRDVKFGIRFVDTFDSRPPAEGAEKNDFNFTFTIGWSYNR